MDAVVENEGTLIAIDPSFTNGLAGSVGVDSKVVRIGERYHSPIPLDCCPDIPVCYLLYYFWDRCYSTTRDKSQYLSIWIKGKGVMAIRNLRVAQLRSSSLAA